MGGPIAQLVWRRHRDVAGLLGHQAELLPAPPREQLMFSALTVELPVRSTPPTVPRWLLKRHARGRRSAGRRPRVTLGHDPGEDGQAAQALGRYTSATAVLMSPPRSW